MESEDNKGTTGLDIEAVRTKLAGKTGKKYWRTLEEVSNTAEFQRFLDDEFPNRSTLDKIDRRTLLKFMGASMALAGLAGCRGVFLPEDTVVPYVKQPEELVPGVALYYATSVLLAGFATGVLVEQHEGRPIQIQGNPEHPASLGSIDVLSQAEILALYDPDRATSPTHIDDLSTWPEYQAAVLDALKNSPGGKGAGVRLLTGSITSPTLVGLIREFFTKYPEAQWHAWEPAGRKNVYLGTGLAFGSPLNPIYDFKAAKVIVSLDADFLNPAETPGSLPYARGFANGRRVHGTSGTMNRVYAFESTQTLVGVMADHRWPVRAVDVFGIASAIAAQVGVNGASAGQLDPAIQANLGAIVDDLKANRGACVVVAGEHQPASVHALAHAINAQLGAIGATVRYTAPIDATLDSRVSDLPTLVQDMNSGQVNTLLIMDSNPVYTAPADIPFADAVKKVTFKAQFGSIPDETTQLMDWHLPMSSTLESWGDARAFDGTAGVIQPLIAPIFDSKSTIEYLGVLLNKKASGYDTVRAYWRAVGLKSLVPTGGTEDVPLKLDSDFEKEWRRVVHSGLVPNSQAVSQNPVPSLNAGSLEAPRVDGVEIVFRAHPSIYDGRLSNSGWLQELPDPLTKTTWDNVVLMSPKFAQQLDLVDDDLVQLELDGAVVGWDRITDEHPYNQVPIYVLPGHPDNTVTVHLGYGRTQGGVVATVTGQEGGGFNAYMLRKKAGLGILGYAGGLKITKLEGASADVATTQGHGPLNGDTIEDERDVIREATLQAYLANPKSLVPDFAPSKEELDEVNLYPDHIFDWNGPQWGMTIDMNTCIGCNACVIACVAENNIPVVGKEQVSRHREMHWIRIDRYYKGAADDPNPQITWQPVACVHCEKAPCEPVCPVAATVHSHEGLNQMIYNRCVGTRYCSNNCPYKVRRFNFLNYSDNQPNFSDRIDEGTFRQSLIPGPLHTPRKDGLELLKLMNNPDVSVRGRGVMEKCSYCVQRINYARIEAKKAGRDIRDGEIVTACQQACPTQTIVFGNVADPNSAVSRLRSDPRSYLLLQELQTRPRTSHLAKLRNPNPEIKQLNG